MRPSVGARFVLNPVRLSVPCLRLSLNLGNPHKLLANLVETALDKSTSHTFRSLSMVESIFSGMLPLMLVNWIGLSSVLRPLQHSIGYMGDGFYRSKNPTKVLKEKTAKENNTKKHKENRNYRYACKNKIIDKYSIQV